MKIACRLYKIPARDTVKNKLDLKYNYLSGKFKNKLKDKNNFTLTSDIWTDIYRSKFTSVLLYIYYKTSNLYLVTFYINKTIYPITFYFFYFKDNLQHQGHWEIYITKLYYSKKKKKKNCI